MNFANGAQTTLAAGMSAVDVTLTVTDASAFPAVPFHVCVDVELMTVTLVVGTTFTVTRGIEGTVATIHAIGQLITLTVTAGDFTGFAAGGGGGDRLVSWTNAPVVKTGSFVLAAYDTLYIANITAASSFQLPAPSANKMVGIQVGSGSTALLTIAAASGNIDGAASRVLWAGERAELWSDGANWYKIGGKSIPMVGVIRLGAPTVGGVAINGAQTKVPTATFEVDNTGIMVDTVNKRLNVRRAGVYAFLGSVVWNLPSAAGTIVTAIYANGVTAVQTGGAINAGHFPAYVCSHPAYSFAAGDFAEVYGGNVTGANQDFYGAAVGVDSASFVSLVEIPTW